MNHIKYIVLHCAATPDDKTFGAENIHDWHAEKGWAGIGYHYVVLRNGEIENGRPEYWAGSHVKGYNSQSLGICFIGTEDMTEEQFASIDSLLLRLKAKYPNAQVVGHCELDPINKKDCPGVEVMEWLNQKRTQWLGV